MVAHVAAGNRAEALRVYERCRRLLAEELGTYPSPETESIYRGLLEAPSGLAETGAAATGGICHFLRRAVICVWRPSPRQLPVLVAAAAVIGFMTRGSDGPRASSGVQTARVALVVPRSPPGSDDPSAQYQAALARARSTYGIDARTLAIDLSKPGLSARVRQSIGGFDLVLLAGQFVDARFADEIARHPHTRFVVMDPDPANEPASLYSAVTKLRNATDLFFVEGPGAYLAGYLSALMAKRRVSWEHSAVVSVIAGDARVNEHQVEGFSAGAAAAVPGATVLVDYSHDFSHPSVCAAIANSQIDRGSYRGLRRRGGRQRGGTVSRRSPWCVGHRSRRGQVLHRFTDTRLHREAPRSGRRLRHPLVSRRHAPARASRHRNRTRRRRDCRRQSNRSNLDSREPRASPATAHDALDLLGDTFELTSPGLSVASVTLWRHSDVRRSALAVGLGCCRSAPQESNLCTRFRNRFGAWKRRAISGLQKGDSACRTSAG